MELRSVSKQTLQRLPLYLSHLKALPKDGAQNISATALAEALGLNDVQVRKDLAAVSSGGRPKIGYITEDLIFDIEQYLGYHDTNSAVVVGAGNLGRALLSYRGFSEFGVDIVAGFDTDPAVIGAAVRDRPILSADKLEGLCRRMRVHIGIIAVPDYEAQSACDALIKSGVLAIWNFAPVTLKVPERVLVKNENIACSLALLSKHLTESMYRSA